MLKAGAYCSAAKFSSITMFDPAHWINYNYQNSLPLTVLAIVTTRFSALTKNIILSKNLQLAPLVDDEPTSQLTEKRSH